MRAAVAYETMLYSSENGYRLMALLPTGRRYVGGRRSRLALISLFSL